MLVYGALLTLWALILGWQVAEHFRVRRAARAELVYRAKDISSTVVIVLRSQRRFGGVVSKERLESALTDLVKPAEPGQSGELKGIALLNAAGDVVASAGTVPELSQKGAPHPPELWEERTVTLMNLVDLGTNLTREVENTNPPIILSRENFFRPGETNHSTNLLMDARFDLHRSTNLLTSAITTNPPPRGDWTRGRPRFGRPFGMSEDQFKTILEIQGVHSFVILMSTDSADETCARDRWLRIIIASLATVSVAGSGLAWRTLSNSAELQIRLLRASELNTHLREMNLAAAGLAHETRNPLNIVRGLAQMISRQPDAPAETREKSRAIVEETDKVTAQLNEFINYSKPRQVRRTALALAPAIQEVVRALGFDLEEKQIKLEVKGDPLTIQADEQLFRQTLFNLMLNAIQAVEPGGTIQLLSGRQNTYAAWLEIRDTGPGVPPERRQEVFKPYFTTNQKGTGLGLAVVQQIVLAHGWEITCLPNEPRGAVFRLTHLTLAT